MAIAVALAMGAVCASPGAWAQAQAAEVRSYDIPAGKLSESLKQLGMQSRLQLLAPPELTRGLLGQPVSGAYTASQALDRLLANSGLSYEFVNAGTVVIKRAPGPAAGRTKSPNGAGNAREKGAEASEATTLDTMTVTGTRIRGGSTPSPVIVIDAGQIRDEGFADLGEVLRSVPQNFSGGQNPGVFAASLTNTANANITGGSGPNLRGLGPDATLTLLNGRRMSYGGWEQAIDISAIPVEAVERIEIVPDGTSAIYGSDAVAGVVNVILKRDSDDVTLGARYATATNGGLTTREYNVTAGTAWSSGGLIATYKDSSADPIYVDQRDYTRHLFNPTALYPGADLRSGLLSARQQLGDIAELHLDALRTERDQFRPSADQDYYFRASPQTMVTLLSPSIDFSLPGDWNLSAGVTRGTDETNTNTIMVAGGTETPFARGCYCNSLRAYEVGAEGPLFALGGGDARLAVGIGYRRNRFRQYDEVFADSDGGSESNRFAYAEIGLPLIGPDANRTGIHRLELTAALRSESYDSFGGVTTPKLGLIYGPSADFTLKASWGKSFKAPTLSQRFTPVQAVLYPAEWLGGIGYPPGAAALDLGGGNLDLRPERARSWTASLAFHPETLSGLEAELSLFDIDYTDRVAGPIVNGSQALSNPLYAPFVDFHPTPESLADILSRYAFFNATGADYDPSNVVAISHGQYINITAQQVRGVDLSGSYRFDIGSGRWSIDGSASWLDSSQKTGPGQDAYDLAGTIFNPARLNGRIGAVWSRAGFTGAVYANYTSGVTNNVTPGVEEKTASFTTFDATLRYVTSERSRAWQGLEFALSVQNLFDRAPPLFTVSSAPLMVPFDSTNYSAIGRLLSLSVSKRW